MAFDIVGQITLFRRLGFIEAGKEIDGTLRELHIEFEYRGQAQNMPILDCLIKKNPIYLYFKQPTIFFTNHSRKLVSERMQDGNHPGVDMLDGFLEAQRNSPDVVDQNMQGAYIGMNFLAGSDTTSVTM